MCVLASIGHSDVAGGDGAPLSPRSASGLLAPTRDGEDPSSLANMQLPLADALPAVVEAYRYQWSPCGRQQTGHWLWNNVGCYNKDVVGPHNSASAAFPTRSSSTTSGMSRARDWGGVPLRLWLQRSVVLAMPEHRRPAQHDAASTRGLRRTHTTRGCARTSLNAYLRRKGWRSTSPRTPRRSTNSHNRGGRRRNVAGSTRK
jgi:hypothetical protein